jgi:hypothetical protein
MVRSFSKIKIVVVLFFIFFFLWFGYVSISKASTPLRDPLVNEKEKISALGLTASLPTEYLEDGSLFWWITDDGIILNYQNNINETVVGDLKLFLSGNPCRTARNLKIVAASEKEKILTVEDEQIVSYSLSIALEPYQAFVIQVEAVGKDECYVDNGDTRNFAGRLDGWIFE